MESSVSCLFACSSRSAGRAAIQKHRAFRRCYHVAVVAVEALRPVAEGRPQATPSLARIHHLPKQPFAFLLKVINEVVFPAIGNLEVEILPRCGELAEVILPEDIARDIGAEELPGGGSWNGGSIQSGPSWSGCQVLLQPDPVSGLAMLRDRGPRKTMRRVVSRDDGLFPARRRRRVWRWEPPSCPRR